MKVVPDLLYVMVAVRSAGHELGRIMREESCERLRHDICELVLRNPIPYIEYVMSPCFQDSTRLPVTLNFVRKEHDAELAGHGIEGLILERQCQGIGLSPLDPT